MTDNKGDRSRAHPSHTFGASPSTSLRVKKRAEVFENTEDRGVAFVLLRRGSSRLPSQLRVNNRRDMVAELFPSRLPSILGASRVKQLAKVLYHKVTSLSSEIGRKIKRFKSSGFQGIAPRKLPSRLRASGVNWAKVE